MLFPPTDVAGWLNNAAWATWGASLATAVLTTKKRRPVRTDLPSGGWVEYTPIQDLKGKHIRAMARVAKMRMSRDDVDDDGEVDVGGLVERMDLADMDEARHDALWALLITSWSFAFPVPVLDKGSGTVSGADILDEIDAEDYARIDEVLDPHAKKIRRRPNPKKATTSSSDGSSRARANGSRKG